MRKILIVIDMQNDFIDGALGTKEAEAIVDDVVAKINEYDPKDIIATRDTHTESYMDTLEGKHLPVIHCVKGTNGWQLNPKVEEALRGAIVIDKPNFGSPALVNVVKDMASKEELEIEMVGICTDICVVSNALLLKANVPDVEVSVDSSCCAGVTPEAHEASLTTMRACQVNVN